MLRVRATLRALGRLLIRAGQRLAAAGSDASRRLATAGESRPPELSGAAGRSRSGRGSRETGPPRSENRASSFHAMWELPAAARLVEVSAVLEIVVPPVVPDLYFWALQVDFASAFRIHGGGHTGLQWNRRYPGGTAVNWGGYASREHGGAILPGSVSDLPGFTDDPHTLAYPWECERPYLLRIFRPSNRLGVWRAEVTELSTGRTSVVRDLYVDGDSLARPIVWSEVFADCDAPSVTVRWSDLQAIDETGNVLQPERIRVNYQPASQGGCTNTTVTADAWGLLQVTNTARTAPQGSVVGLRGR